MWQGGSLGKLIIFIGVAIVIFGLVVMLVSQAFKGRGAPLPGDIVIHKRNVTIFLPIVSSIVVSIILTVLLWLLSAVRR